MVGIGGVDYDASKLNSKDVGAGGILQTDLTTIELGFAPFIPLSKRYPSNGCQWKVLKMKIGFLN